MHYASDNAGPAHPAVMAALAEANAGYAMPYGNDDLSARVVQQLRDLFEAPEAAVHLVATGTAANALCLATMTRPWQTVFCSDVAHILMDECGAPEMFGGAMRLTPVAAPEAKMTPQSLRAAITATREGDVHGLQRGPVSLTNITERGTLYELDEIRALTDVAREFGLKTHLDGARFANACAALGCSPAEMSWRAGIDAVSFGGTKNGLLGVEAAVIFDPELAWEFQIRRKRAAQLFSKHRFLASQMGAYVTGDLWLEMARAANAACAALAEGLRAVPGVRLLHAPQGNMIYAEWPRAAHRRLLAAGAQYYVEGDLDGPDDGPGDAPVPARLVCDWSARAEDRERFLELLRG